jgi:hypothetical protein
LSNNDETSGRNSQELEAQENYDLERIIAHALRMNNIKNEEILEEQREHEAILKKLVVVMD